MRWFNKNGWVFILIAAVMWAMDGFLRRSLYSLQPGIIVFYEHLIGFLILVPIVGGRMVKEKLTRKEFAGVVMISLLSGLLGTLWFTAALAKVNYISISVVYLIQKLQPIFAMGSARILLKEKINQNFWVWAVLALGAGFFVTFPMGKINWETGSGTVMAAILALGAAIAWGSSTALSRMALLNRPFEVIAAWRFGLTTLFSLIFVLVTGLGSNLDDPTPIQWGRFVIIAVSTGMLALLFYYRGLKSIKAQVATFIELVFPALVIIMDGVINQTWLHPTQYLSGVVLLFAMYRIVKTN